MSQIAVEIAYSAPTQKSDIPNTPTYIPLRFDTCHQSQEQNKRFGGDFVINNVPIITGEHERAAPNDLDICQGPLPIFFTVKGPATIRRLNNDPHQQKGSKPYVVSNGGNPLASNEGTAGASAGGGGGGG